MPTPEEILAGLALAANKFINVSILWHLIMLFFMIPLIMGKKFNTKHVASGLGIFLLGVGMVAVLVNNPFNSVIFTLSALIFGIITLKFKPVPVSLKWDFVAVIGLLLVIFGFVYPHFLENAPLYKYLYAAPLGIIPCPTLSAFIGITLMLHGFGSKKFMLTGALIGLFYGIFGVLRLKVYIDITLIAGALFLMVYTFTIKKSEVAAG